MAGTASTVSNWLLLEHAGPWGRHALHDARLPQDLGRELDHLQRRHRVRILLIRRPDRRTQGGVTVFAIHSGPDEPWIEHTVLDSIGEAAGLDLERLGHAETARFRTLSRARCSWCAPTAAAIRVAPSSGGRWPGRSGTRSATRPGRARTSAATGSPATWWPSPTVCTSAASTNAAGSRRPRRTNAGRSTSNISAAGRAARWMCRPPSCSCVSGSMRPGSKTSPLNDGDDGKLHHRPGLNAGRPLRRRGRAQDRRRSSAHVPQRTRRTTHVVRAGVDRTDLKVRRSPAGPPLGRIVVVGEVRDQHELALGDPGTGVPRRARAGQAHAVGVDRGAARSARAPVGDEDRRP